MVELLDISLWINRIADNAPRFQGRVYGAALFEAALTQGAPRQMPAAYIIQANDDASRNNLDTALSQRVTVKFSVVIAIRNAADATGADSSKALKAIREEAMIAVLNWTPDGSIYDVTEFVRGGLSRFQNAVLWWEDVYQTAFYVRA
jgi:hypothetical protein